MLALPGRAVPNFTTKELTPGITLNGVKFSSAIFVSMTGGYADAGGGVRGFYIRGSSQGASVNLAVSSAVFSARSNDGLAWTDESGIRVSSVTQPLIDIAISSITGATVVPITGGYRMLYSVLGSTGAYAIYTATSADGLNWGNQYSTAVVTSANNGLSWLGSPSAVVLNSGDIRLYYTQNAAAGGNVPNNAQIISQISTNGGATFTTPLVELSPANEVAAFKRTDGRVRLIYTSPVTATTTSFQMLSAISNAQQGHVFAAEAGVRLSTTQTVGSMYYPDVVRSTDGFRLRVYYTWLPFAPVVQSTGDINAAVTDFPDLQSIAPASVANNNSNQAFTLSGEVFDPVITSSCALAGVAGLIGTGIVRNSDMSVTVTFPTQGAPAGTWDVVVANSNGLSSTLPAALTITSVAQGAGTVSLLDNLFRPLQGGKVTINVQTFAAGIVTIKIYSIHGKLINTLWDANLAAGANAFTWNGASAQGAVVASGVYVLKITGPELNSISKIIVIK